MTLQRVAPKVVPGQARLAVLQRGAVVRQHGVPRVVEAQSQLRHAHVVLDVQGAQKDVFMRVHLVLVFSESNGSVVHKDGFPQRVVTIEVPLLHPGVQSVVSAHDAAHQPLVGVHPHLLIVGQR